ncbi:MAG: ATP-binding cassette domain-containing protein [Rhodomicrobiaceae bacterium]
MALELRDATVLADGNALIADVTLVVKPGKLTIILGANGAGKSTALAVLSGDMRPARGRAMLDGVPLADIPLLRLAERRAVVLQHSPINFALRVHEVVALSRSTFGTVDAAADAVEEAALRALDLLPMLDREYATLSGGERQRVQIARALAQLGHNARDGLPGYLLMDEPTAHLDLKQQIVALEAARDFAANGGAALCILHDIALARDFSDELVLMKDGRIAACGEARELLTAELIAEIYRISGERARQFALT